MTNESEVDVVIVGARCAGATLATFLARAGARVLLLDQDRMPSDHVLSTHSINPPGMDVLDEVGVGDAVRAIAPPSHILRINLGGEPIDLTLPERRGVYGPRRERLDGLLQGAAVSSGVRFHDRARVISLIEERGRVRGVRAIIGERERTVTAGLVVGADGRHSTVAKLTGAEEYLGYDAPRATYWGYWNAPALWKTDPAYRFDVYFGLLGRDVHAIFQTDHDQLLIGSSPAIGEVAKWRADPAGLLGATLGSDPIIARLIEGSSPVGKVRGTIHERFFFRRSAGNGWALVGDAGHHKEFLLGDGITEALLQARGLATAITQGNDAALTRWWRARDVSALPSYFVGQVAGSVERPDELARIVFSRVAAQPALMERMVAVMDRRLSPYEALSVVDVLPWIVGAALRGRWRVIGETIAMARRARTDHREMRLRGELLAEAVAEVGAEAWRDTFREAA